MPVPSLRHIPFLLTATFAITSSGLALAYSPGNHKKSIIEGAEICLKKYGVSISGRDLNDMVRGVEEPDDPSLSALQMFKQRFEPGSYGRQRNISTIRIVAQSIHGSPNPTRRLYTSSKRDQQALKGVIRVPRNKLMKERLDVDVFSYDTNQGVRNKLLINASQFMCVSLAHISDEQSARKFGNMMHMIGDTYSASHVQRSAPVGSPAKCGTEKIEWHYSMDLISWKQHRPADLNNRDWRFRCLKEHAADLMRQWSASREAVKKVASTADKRIRANSEVRKTLKLLCNRILRADRAVLERPAGGANAGYSSASGVDYWEALSKKIPDLAIQPVGLTSAAEAKAFYAGIARKLKKEGSEAEYSYPSRDYPDFCINILSTQPLKAPLTCTATEIDWAVRDSSRVKTMWIPARKLH